MNTDPSPDQGRHRGAGHCGDPARAARHRHDQSVFHTLLARHTEIRRTVTRTAQGIVTLTISGSADIVALLHDHAHEMHRRMTEGFGLRHWDPAFAEIFAQKDKVQMQVETLPDGVRVVETSDDPNVVLLIQAHGAQVSRFVAGGAKVAAQQSPLPDAYRRVTG
ncbi:MAG: hypothetical protein PHX82_08865 [Paracoccaceae bacterium]|nr:hypothetical protein [Paracoccaceae bacterium]